MSVDNILDHPSLKNLKHSMNHDIRSVIVKALRVLEHTCTLTISDFDYMTALEKKDILSEGISTMINIKSLSIEDAKTIMFSALFDELDDKLKRKIRSLLSIDNNKEKL